MQKNQIKLKKLSPLVAARLKPTTKEIVFSVNVSALSSFLFGFFIAFSNFFIKNFQERNNTELSPNIISFFTSIHFIGALIGNIFISSMSLDRKMVIFTNNLLYLLFFLGTCFSPNIPLFILSRFLIGISIGITGAYVPSYVSEISSVNNRGKLGCFHQLYITFGVTGGLFSDAFLSNYQIIIISSTILIFSFLSLLICKSEIESEGKTVKELLSLKKSKKSLLLASLFHLFQQASGVNVVVCCSNAIMEKENVDPKNTFYIGLSQTFACLLTIGFIEKLGRKILMIFSVAGICIALLIISLTKFISMGMYMFIFSFAIGLGPVTWFITGEIIPPEFRNATNMIATSMNWLFGFLTVYSKEFLFDKYGKKMFLFYLGNMLLYLCYLTIFFKETKGRRADFLE